MTVICSEYPILLQYILLQLLVARRSEWCRYCGESTCESAERP